MSAVVGLEELHIYRGHVEDTLYVPPVVEIKWGWEAISSCSQNK